MYIPLLVAIQHHIGTIDCLAAHLLYVWLYGNQRLSKKNYNVLIDYHEKALLTIIYYLLSNLQCIMTLFKDSYVNEDGI